MIIKPTHQRDNTKKNTQYLHKNTEN